MKERKYRISEMGIIGRMKSYSVYDKVVKSGVNSFRFNGNLADCLAWIILKEKGFEI